MAKTKKGAEFMSPMKPCFAGKGGHPDQVRGKLELSQTYSKGQGTVIPDPVGHVITPLKP